MNFCYISEDSMDRIGSTVLNTVFTKAVVYCKAAYGDYSGSSNPVKFVSRSRRGTIDGGGRAAQQNDRSALALGTSSSVIKNASRKLTRIRRWRAGRRNVAHSFADRRND